MSSSSLPSLPMTNHDRRRMDSSIFRKHRLRAAFRATAFVLLVAGYWGYNQVATYYDLGGNAVESSIRGSSTSTSTTKPTRQPHFAQQHRILTAAGTHRGTNSIELGGSPWPTASVETTFDQRQHRQVSGGGSIAAAQRELQGYLEFLDAEVSAAPVEQEQDIIFNQQRRQTQAQNETEVRDPCAGRRVAEPKWFLLWYILGVLYMFLALAIVCDEFFVPALEEMADAEHLNLSMDVAGATLMAAGGSAPELFTNLFGTFQESEIGFGTIVGSAVFNVLFVIACCAFLAKEMLQLTWWPLFRDCIYYVIGLLVVAVFVGVVSPGRIYAWEAAVLFVMYFGYVAIMYFNERIYFRITGKELYADEDGENGESTGGENGATANGAAGRDGMVAAITGVGVAEDEGEETEGGRQEPGENTASENPTTSPSISPSSPPVGSERPGMGAKQQSKLRIGSEPWAGTFRAGVLKLLRDPESWSKTGGVGIVSQLQGDVDVVFRQVDQDGNGVIDRDELSRLFQTLNCHLTEEQLDAALEEIDQDRDGEINEAEFIKWYVRSEERIQSKIKSLFERIDANNSGTIDRHEVRKLLEELEPRVTDADVDEALEAMYQSGSREEITYQEFSDWYTHSLLYDRQVTEMEEELGGVFEFILPPKGGGCFAYTKWVLVLPLLLVMTLTIPDVRVLHWGKFGKCKGKFCYLAFFISILWIGVFSFFMVGWTEIIGHTIGIPSVIMGLTFLAAGTSVPDLLSSVVVARKGEGDMAVSSSIGSNIFDILVGLPLPWILYTAWPTKPDYVLIGADGVWVSIIVLLVMVVLVVLSIHFSGWKLTKPLGIFMFVLYAAFLVQAIWLQWPFPKCDVR